MPLHAVLFDLDGTITEPAAGILGSISYALTSLGHKPPAPEELRWCIGPPLRVSFPKLLKSEDPALVERAVALYRERYVERGLYECTLYPRVAEVIASLAQSYRLYLATAKPAVYADKLMHHFDLRRHLAGVYGPDLSGRFDDKVELVAHLLATEKLEPRQCAMVGDRAGDMAAAVRNRVHAIGITWGYGDERELRTAGAAHLVASPDELPPLLTRL